MITKLRSAWSRRPGRGAHVTTLGLGLATVALLLIAGVCALFAPELQQALSPGDEVKAEFATNYRDRLVPTKSTVKFGGIEVGKVSDVEYTDHGTALITMKVDMDLSLLGPAPSAAVRPYTILGGGYSVDLSPGGGPGTFDTDTVIPEQRTSMPVDLDTVLDALPSQTRDNLQHVVKEAGDTLAPPGRDALRDVVQGAPGTLGPAADVLQAAQGTHPASDLTGVVSGLENTAQTVNAQDGALGSIVDSLDTTTGTLSAESRPLAQTIATLPQTLDSTRRGLGSLDGTLGRLTTTAENFQPAAKKVAPLLQELNPVLQEAEPVVRDLKPVLDDARPAVQELVPTTSQLTGVLNDVRGPVLDRVNGPILDTVLNTFQGKNEYAGSGGGIQANHKFYEEAGYLVSNLDRASMVQDHQGSGLNFQVGAGLTSVVAGDKKLPDLTGLLNMLNGGQPVGRTGPPAPSQGLGQGAPTMQYGPGGGR